MMALQVHLLLVAVLHHHGKGVVPRSVAVLGTDHHASLPSVDSGLLCTACQIVRHSAVRPALTAPLPELAAATPLPRAFAPSPYRFLQYRAANGRAPPLA